LDRRDFVKGMGAALAAPLLSSLAMENTEAKAAPAQPNVVLIICDDLGYGDIGCYGSLIRTPNLDKLAERGTRYTHFNAGHSLCSASRAALLTGRYAKRSHTANAYSPLDTVGMDLDETTIANLFHQKGYETMAIGKWHLGNTPDYLPTSRGFDHFYGVQYSVDMQPLRLIRDTTILEEDTERKTLTPRYTEEAVKFLNAASERPFFLYLAYSYPHDPVAASQNFANKSHFGPFGDAVEEIDWSVGQVMQTLESTGKLSNTIFLFTSDHGPWFQGNPGMLRGRKGSTFEGGFRVPLIVRWPGHIPAGEVQGVWASNLDVLPTLAAWCGLENPKLPLDGVDASELLTGKVRSVERPAVLYFTGLTDEPYVHCARSGPWKLRFAQTNGQNYVNDQQGHINYLLEKPELYNLDHDPAESYDVADVYPLIVENILADIERQIPTFPPEVVAAYAALKQNPASKNTPPGASPRPANFKPLSLIYVPPDRRSVD
jgi:arylsulfatase